MLISYPLLGLVPSEVFAENAIDKISGTYPVTQGQAWHGGVHISFPATGGNEVRAIADGIVIAYRIPTEKPKDAAMLEAHPLNYAGWTDDGFVLLKHEKESGENTKVRFFSLYMHLSELPKTIFKGAAGAIQSGGDIQIKRKQKLGKLGRVYGQDARLHFEIFTDDAGLNAFFKRGKEKYQVDDKGCGEKDLWGDVHFVIPAGTAYYSQEPGIEPPKSGKKTEETLCITVQYRSGDRIVTACRENGEQIGQQTGKEYKENKDYEYNLYKLAQKRFPKNVSAGYELLRHGRIYGPDAAPADARNWQYLPLGFGRHGWVDLNQSGIKKLSDADFPYWKWKYLREDSGVFNPSDGKCEVAELLQAIDPDQDGIAAPLEFKWLFNDRDAAERLKYTVCQFPCEWDATDADKKWNWLKDYFKNPATLKKELAEKHKKWIDGVKTRSENQLKTAQSDIKLAQDAKKEKQSAIAELRKQIADRGKQATAGEAQLKTREKEAAKPKANTKPEDKARAQKQVEEARAALEEIRAARRQSQDMLGEAEQQLEDIDVSIGKLQAKIDRLEATLKAVPKATEAADADIKAAEEALKKPGTNVDQEKSWKEFKAHMEALQWWDKVKPLPSSSVWHFHPLAFIDHFRKCHWLGKDELKLAYKDSDEAKLEKYRIALNKVLFKYGINTSTRISHFLGQGAQESGQIDETKTPITIRGFVNLVETSNPPFNAESAAPETNAYYNNPKDVYYTHVMKYDGRNGNIIFESLYDKKGDLVTAIPGTGKQKSEWADQNIDIAKSKAGDGQKYRGRGMKQLTGRYNYTKYWVYRGWLDEKTFDDPWWPAQLNKRAPIVDDAQRISVDTFNCIDTAGWYWTTRSINRAIVENNIDDGTITAVTHAINGAATEGAPSFNKNRKAATKYIKLYFDDSP